MAVKSLSALLVLPLFVLPATPVLAQNSAAQCATIAADADRLACYDSVFRVEGVTAAVQAVVIESDQLIPARPSGRAPATLTVSCEPTGLQIAFGFAGNTISALGRDAGLTLQYDLQRRSSTLPVNADNTAILISNARDARAFIDSLAGITNLTLRFTPANTRTLSVRFPVDAILQAAAPIVASCQ